MANRHSTFTVAGVVCCLALLAGVGGAAAKPGSLALEAYGPEGRREFAGYYSYYHRVYSPAQGRRLRRIMRGRLRFLRRACGQPLWLTRRNLRMIHAHQRAGNRVLVKRYDGRRGGRRVFVSLCDLRPGVLRPLGATAGGATAGGTTAGGTAAGGAEPAAPAEPARPKVIVVGGKKPAQ